ncbi:MAG TPA: HD domain-containing phosphohydrolase [Candidatus Acidoferrales bacterium]|jgi:HD-GYP domain-containing protein (c-di-GMP phosphodiesterase class II)|nr:HD domain-containing phosphohydrolase [Candidatus Acidoferrales bacterium]
MPKDHQIWYLERSPAAKIVEPLRESYTLREVCVADGKGITVPTDDQPVVLVGDLEKDNVQALREVVRTEFNVRLIGLVDDAGKLFEQNEDAGEGIFAYVRQKAPAAVVKRAVEAAFENIDLAIREREVRENLERTQREMDELNQIGVALSSTRDINTLLTLILQKTREVTGADAGSLYLVEQLSETERRLRFKITQNDTAQFPFAEFTMPITEKSMAGYVALHGEVINLPDAYAIPSDRPYQFNPKIDQDSGYKTRSMLTLPMKNAKGEVLGVLQLINAKQDFRAMIRKPEAFEEQVEPFTGHDVRLALSLGSQAAVAYENSKLYEDIETLFEGFVKAAVTAIEQRDPTTSGHSFRVSTLTVGLAEKVDRATTGPYAGVNFTREQMKEVRYAALLHDFGKVGVREQVLVKARKLYPMQLDLVKQRFDYIRKELEARISRQKLSYLLEKSREEALAQVNSLDEEYKRQLAELDEYMQFILQVNEPTVLPQGKFERLLDIAAKRYTDPLGIEHDFLNPDEVRLLSIPKGSLDDSERQEIESHVIHTFNFLTQIPWTKEIKNIPLIARAHHEKLNGRGYPYKLKEPEIPLQSKMMTICDIFDALSASDRPYKRAVPVEKALDILRFSVKDSELDPVLFDLFLEAKIYALTIKR